MKLQAADVQHLRQHAKPFAAHISRQHDKGGLRVSPSEFRVIHSDPLDDVKKCIPDIPETLSCEPRP